MKISQQNPFRIMRLTSFDISARIIKHFAQLSAGIEFKRRAALNKKLRFQKSALKTT